MLDAQTSPALSKPFEDEGEDHDTDEETVEREERATRNLEARHEVRVRRVGEALAEASSATREAASQLRQLLAEDGAEEALAKTPGFISSRVEGLDEAIAALKELFPKDEPAPVADAPAKKTKR